MGNAPSTVDGLCKKFKDDYDGHEKAALKVICDKRIPNAEDKGHVLNAYWTRRNVRELDIRCECLFILFRSVYPPCLFINEIDVDGVLCWFVVGM